VAFGAAEAMAALLKAIANGQAGEIEGRQIWLRVATWMMLALEFATKIGRISSANQLDASANVWFSPVK